MEQKPVLKGLWRLTATQLRSIFQTLCNQCKISFSVSTTKVSLTSYIAKADISNKTIKGVGLSKEKALHSFYSYGIEAVLEQSPQLYPLVEKLLKEQTAAQNVPAKRFGKDLSQSRDKRAFWGDLSTSKRNSKNLFVDTLSQHNTGTQTDNEVGQTDTKLDTGTPSAKAGGTQQQLSRPPSVGQHSASGHSGSVHQLSRPSSKLFTSKSGALERIRQVFQAGVGLKETIESPKRNMKPSLTAVHSLHVSGFRHPQVGGNTEDSCKPQSTTSGGLRLGQSASKKQRFHSPGSQVKNVLLKNIKESPFFAKPATGVQPTMLSKPDGIGSPGRVGSTHALLPRLGTQMPQYRSGGRLGSPTGVTRIGFQKPPQPEWPEKYAALESRMNQVLAENDQLKRRVTELEDGLEHSKLKNKVVLSHLQHLIDILLKNRMHRKNLMEQASGSQNGNSFIDDISRTPTNMSQQGHIYGGSYIQEQHLNDVNTRSVLPQDGQVTYLGKVLSGTEMQSQSHTRKFLSASSSKDSSQRVVSLPYYLGAQAELTEQMPSEIGMFSPQKVTGKPGSDQVLGGHMFSTQAAGKFTTSQPKEHKILSGNRFLTEAEDSTHHFGFTSYSHAQQPSSVTPDGKTAHNYSLTHNNSLENIVQNHQNMKKTLQQILGLNGLRPEAPADRPRATSPPSQLGYNNYMERVSEPEHKSRERPSSPVPRLDLSIITEKRNRVAPKPPTIHSPPQSPGLLFSGANGLAGLAHHGTGSLVGPATSVQSGELHPGQGTAFGQQKFV